MKELRNRERQRGSASSKLLIVVAVLALIAHAGINYIPVAYEGATLRQEMDTAVVRGLAATGQMKPVDTVKASMQRALSDYTLPPETFVEIKPEGKMITARVVYTKPVNILPFGIYKYNYEFDYTAQPAGYLMKQ